MISSLSLKRFPVMVALAAWLIYLATLAHGVTLSSLSLTANQAGWNYLPVSGQPLFWLFTLPLRLLPACWLPMALNIFSATCAAITLGFMMATLEQAKWDHRLKSLPAWIAPLPLLLAAAVCGLEFSFWQAATQATGDALQVLLLAVAIWCLFKHSANCDQHWLQAATFVWGLGMVENWMMLITLPLFLISLVWLGGVKLMNVRILVQLALAGLAGFSIIIILPMVNGLSASSPWSFGHGWWVALKEPENIFVNVYYRLWRVHRMAALTVIIFYLIAILPLLMAPDKSIGKRSVVWIYRALRGSLLLVCLWLALDPVAGPREIYHKQTGMALPLTSFDYLLGLGAGLLAGNLLLGFLARSVRCYNRGDIMEVFMMRAAPPLAVLLFGFVTAILICRNAPAITLANRQPFMQFGELALQQLPPGGGVVLSDEPLRLWSFQAAAAVRRQSRQWVALDIRDLPDPVYRREVALNHPDLGLLTANQDNLRPAEMVALLYHLARSNRIYYLHPSFGYFFEYFYLAPAGLGQEMRPFPDKSVNPPPLTAETINRTEKFWDSVQPLLEADQVACTAKSGPVLQKIYSRFLLQPVRPAQSQLLGEWYAVALDDWGVQLQRAGQLAAAQKRFEQAIALNEDNTAAKINFQVNTNLAAGMRLHLAGVKKLAEELRNKQGLTLFLSTFGPIDEPTFAHLIGLQFAKIRESRQAMQQFERAHTLAPDEVAPQLQLAELYTQTGLFEKAHDIIRQLRERISTPSTNEELPLEISLIEYRLWITQTNTAMAWNVLKSVMDLHPNNPRLLDVALHACLNLGDYPDALKLVDRRLLSEPDNLTNLMSKAQIYLLLGQTGNALGVLDHMLTISNLPAIRLERATIQAAAGQSDVAEMELREFESTQSNNPTLYLGLAEVARHRGETNRTIAFLEHGRALLPTNSLQAIYITQQINRLKSTSTK
jgi:tetratricopeptide (TPR) repeat protein/type III secretory pathway component EscS